MAIYRRDVGWLRGLSFKAKMLVAMISVAPFIGLLVCGYNVAVTRYVARHVVVATEGAVLPEGQIVAVTGTIEAPPAIMPPNWPPFEQALMGVERYEHHRSGRHSGWKPSGLNRSISQSGQLSGWKLTERLIANAGFDWHQASPCFDYRTPPGWTTDCPGPYLYDIGDDDSRMSYEVTPLIEGPVTIIAAVSSSQFLVPIAHHQSASANNLVIWAYGNWAPAELLAQQLHGQVAWLVFWITAALLVPTVYFYHLQRRRRAKTEAEAISGALWRSAVTLLPLSALAWPFDQGGYVPAALYGGCGALAIFGALWIREYNAMPIR